MGPERDVHEARLDRRARCRAERIRREHRGAPPRATWSRPLRIAGQALRRLVLSLRDAATQHWDVGAFDLVFGSLKAFGIYPALFALGIGWTIPLAEYAPLNTQLWTAGYLLLRRRIASILGRWRFGYTLARLDARREVLAGGSVPSGVARHSVEIGGALREIRILRSGWARLRSRLRGRRERSGAGRDGVSLGTLRRWIGDPELCLRAARHRHNALLYERILLHLALATAGGRRKVESHSAILLPWAGGAVLAGELDLPEEAIRTALVDQADALRAGLGHGSLERMALRWLHGTYRRKIRREMGDRRQAIHWILAALLDAESGCGGERLEELRREAAAGRERLERWTARCEAFAARAERAGSDAELRRALVREVAWARALGLRPRRAGAVAHRGECLRAAEVALDGAPFGAGR